jgi:hypothetical protein
MDKNKCPFWFLKKKFIKKIFLSYSPSLRNKCCSQIYKKCEYYYFILEKLLFSFSICQISTFGRWQKWWCKARNIFHRFYATPFMVWPRAHNQNITRTDYAVAVQKWCISHDFYAVSEKFLKKYQKIPKNTTFSKKCLCSHSLFWILLRHHKS